MSEVYEVIVIHEDKTEEWVPCLDARELEDGRLAAEVIPGNVIFRKPGRWRKVEKSLFGGKPVIDHVRQEIKDLVRRGNVTSAELSELRCNSWEWEALVSAMTDEAFVERTEYTLKNCSQPRAKGFAPLNERPLLALLERTPEGHINNCALANGDEEKNCQICARVCPDRARFGVKP